MSQNYARFEVLTCLKYIFLETPNLHIEYLLNTYKLIPIDPFSHLSLKSINLSTIFNPNFIIFPLNKYQKIGHFIKLQHRNIYLLSSQSILIHQYLDLIFCLLFIVKIKIQICILNPNINIKLKKVISLYQYYYCQKL